MTHARSSGPLAAAYLTAALCALAGCATMRAEFESRGESLLFAPEVTSTPAFWLVDESVPNLLTRATGSRASALHLSASPGGATLPGSLVSDFRMEFSVRLDEGQAMVNFRNYFDNRYCVVIQPEWLELRVARKVHAQLDYVTGTEVFAGYGVWQHYEIVAVGPLVRVFKEGRLVLQATVNDPPSPMGNIWFESHEGYSFGDVLVARIDDFVRKEKRAAGAAASIPAAREADRAVLAVGGFAALGVAEYQASLLCDIYADALVRCGAFRVIDRSELAAVLTEQELQLSALAGPEGAARVGRLLNAAYLSTGSAGAIGSGYSITARIIKVETGETLASVTASYPDADSAVRGMKALVDDLTRAFSSGDKR